MIWYRTAHAEDPDPQAPRSDPLVNAVATPSRIRPTTVKKYLRVAFIITEGLWFARSPEAVHSKVMETLVWLRVPGDIVYALGAARLGVYALKLLRPDRRTRTDRAQPA